MHNKPITFSDRMNKMAQPFLSEKLNEFQMSQIIVLVCLLILTIDHLSNFWTTN